MTDRVERTASAVPSGEILYPVAEVAELWRCSKNFIYDLIVSGELCAIQLGRGKAKTRVPQSAIDEYKQRNASPVIRRRTSDDGRDRG